MKGKNTATGETGTPTDFISFHAKGQPKDVKGRVQMGISSQLRDIDGAFAVIARYPEFANTPIVIGESDPEGCAACQGPNLAYRNSTMYSSYTVATFPNKLDLAAQHSVNLLARRHRQPPHLRPALPAARRTQHRTHPRPTRRPNPRRPSRRG